MQRFTTFEEVNNYLSLSISTITSYNLNNIHVLMEYLGNPQNDYKVIHIAGTSGKTSTAYFVSALLKATGKKVGLTVSPVVDEVNERVQINLTPINEDVFTQSFTKFINKLSDLSIQPSRFELVIAFAFWHFAEQKVDYAVIEVGLGGLYDATNVITNINKVCLITDIGYDHVHVLGDTLSKIATHKAGIIGPQNQVLMHKQNSEVMDVIKKKASENNANLTVVKAVPNREKTLPDYQQRNWQLAYAAYEYIKHRDGLKTLKSQELRRTKYTQVPARMDIKKYKDKTIILDGAHNSQKMAAFITSFNKLYPGVRPAVLVAVKQSKDYQDLADQLSEVASSIITTNFQAHAGPRTGSFDAAQLKDAFTKVNSLSIDDSIEAFRHLLKSEEDILIVTGSIYLISELRSKIAFLK